jgi:Spy/CpxP family protein refolding chaperone
VGLTMKGRIFGEMAFVTVAAAALTAGLLCAAQYGQSGGGVPLQQGQGQVGPHQQGSFSAGPDTDSVFAEKRMRALNADRQKSMVSDAQKLLELARQLDAEVASNPKDELTSEEARKLAEIEKLARSVKTKMAQSFAGGPSVSRPVQTLGGLGVD